MNYLVVVIVFITGLYIVVSSKNLIKKIVGLGVFQTSILLFYISLGKVYGGVPPVLDFTKISVEKEIFVNPLPQVLMLTAIVVGIATMSVAMALIIRVKDKFYSVEEDVILEELNRDELTS
jgi:multicomponent Na+:H+ antiporter subunit C